MPDINLEVDTLDAVPEPLRPLYVQEGGKYRLPVKGIEDVSGLKSALNAERDTRSALEKKLRETADQYKDIDPAKAREAMQKLRELDEKKLLETGDVDKLVEQRTERMRGDYENQIKAFGEKYAAGEERVKSLQGRLSEVLIDKAIGEAALKAGAKKTALPDVILRARLLFTIDDDGNPVPKRDGKIMYGKDPHKPMSPEEWVSTLTAEAPHLFEPNTGGGARNDGGGNGGRGIQLSREEARNPAKYRAAKARAEKEGIPLLVEGMP